VQHVLVVRFCLSIYDQLNNAPLKKFLALKFLIHLRYYLFLPAFLKLVFSHYVLLLLTLDFLLNFVTYLFLLHTHLLIHSQDYITTL